MMRLISESETNANEHASQNGTENVNGENQIPPTIDENEVIIIFDLRDKQEKQIKLRIYFVRK